MKPLSKLWVLCSSQSILMSGAQHDLLEKLLFENEVGVSNSQDTSFFIHVKAPISRMARCFALTLEFIPLLCSGVAERPV